MRRGDLYRVYKGTKDDPKNYRVYLVVSRQLLVDSIYSSVICAPVYSNYDDIPTQVKIGVNEGMKYDCAVRCDELYSIRKDLLTNYIGSIDASKMEKVNSALRVALDIE